MKKSSLLAFILFLSLNFTAEAKFLNLKVNALSFLLGGLNAGVNVNLGGNLSIGASYSKLEAGTAEATGTRGNVEIFFNDFSSDSWFIEAFYEVASAEASSTNLLTGATTTTTSDATSYGAVIGYQWMWSTFNQQLALGYQNITIDSESTLFSELSGGFPALVYNIGLAF